MKSTWLVDQFKAATAEVRLWPAWMLRESGLAEALPEVNGKLTEPAPSGPYAFAADGSEDTRE